MNRIKLVVCFCCGISLGIALALSVRRQLPTLGSPTPREAEVPTFVHTAYDRDVTDHTHSLDWQTNDEEALTRLITRLRSLGAPDPVLCDLTEGYYRRTHISNWLQKLGGSTGFWRVEGFQTNPEILNAESLCQNELIRSASDAVRRLDPSIIDHSTLAQLKEALQMVRLGFLSDEKRRLVSRLQETRREETEAILSKPHEDPNILHREMTRIQQDHLRAVKAALTQEEAFEYDLRFSERAVKLRAALTHFDHSEQEFRGLYRLLEESGSSDPRNWEQNDHLRERVPALLGETRVADLKRSLDPFYQAMRNFVRRSGLPDTVASDIYLIRSSLREDLHATMTRGDLNAEQKVGLGRLKMDAVAEKVRAALGAEVYSQYASGSLGGWLNPLDRIGPPQK